MNRREFIVAGLTVGIVGCSGILECRFPRHEMKVNQIYRREIVETRYEDGVEVYRREYNLSGHVGLPITMYRNNNKIHMNYAESLFQMIERYRGGCERSFKILLAFRSNINNQDYDRMADPRNPYILSQLGLLDRFFVVYRIDDAELFVDNLANLQRTVGNRVVFGIEKKYGRLNTELRILGYDYIIARRSNHLELYPLTPGVEDLESRYGTEYSIFRGLYTPNVVLERILF
ncbi:MAG: hypothetical protein NZ908_02515 [Candidatus Micrarchaeota archaeon]|nr:hypothetical protein [Candidatus Micrarchaeota archaeon]MCX8154808.1 hypothetical protein [Candidatus Micrarchaeota archaeon]